MAKNPVVELTIHVERVSPLKRWVTDYEWSVESTDPLWVQPPTKLSIGPAHESLVGDEEMEDRLMAIALRIVVGQLARGVDPFVWTPRPAPTPRRNPSG